MIIYTDPQTGYQCKCSSLAGVPDSEGRASVDPKYTSPIPYKNVPSNKRDEFNTAITDYVNGLPVFDLTKAKAIKVKEAKQEASDLVKAITDNYSPDEIATWDTQKAEAKAAKKDGFLNQLAINSGILVDDLIVNVLAKVTAYEALSAESIGRRKKKEAACMAATTIEELKAVVF